MSKCSNMGVILYRNGFCTNQKGSTRMKKRYDIEPLLASHNLRPEVLAGDLPKNPGQSKRYPDDAVKGLYLRVAMRTAGGYNKSLEVRVPGSTTFEKLCAWPDKTGELTDADTIRAKAAQWIAQIKAGTWRKPIPVALAVSAASQPVDFNAKGPTLGEVFDNYIAEMEWLRDHGSKEKSGKGDKLQGLAPRTIYTRRTCFNKYNKAEYNTPVAGITDSPAWITAKLAAPFEGKPLAKGPHDTLKAIYIGLFTHAGNPPNLRKLPAKKANGSKGNYFFQKHTLTTDQANALWVAAVTQAQRLARTTTHVPTECDDPAHERVKGVCTSPRVTEGDVREQRMIGRYVHFMALTGTRLDELRTLEWSAVDTDARLIVIPGDNTKTSHALRLPITDAHVAILEAARADNPWHGTDDARGAFVFCRGGKRGTAGHIGKTATANFWIRFQTAHSLKHRITNHALRYHFAFLGRHFEIVDRVALAALENHTVHDDEQANYEGFVPIEKLRAAMDAMAQGMAELLDPARRAA